MKAHQFGFLAVAFIAGFFAGAWWTTRQIEAALSTTFAVAAQGAQDAQGTRSVGSDAPAARTGTAAAASATTPSNAAPDVESPKPSKPLKNLPPELAELIGRLQAAPREFEAQKRDDSWAPAQEARLRQLFESSRALLPTGARLVEVDCRTTMCAMAIEDAPAEAGPNGHFAKRFSAFSDLLLAQRYGVDLVQGPDPRYAGETVRTNFLVHPDIQFVQPGERGN